MGEKTDVWQGTLSLMVLRTMDSMGSQHGYGLPRRIEQTSGDLLQVNYGTLYPALLKVEQEGFIRSRRVPHLRDVLVLVAKVGNLDSNRAVPPVLLAPPILESEIAPLPTALAGCIPARIFADSATLIKRHRGVKRARPRPNETHPQPKFGEWLSLVEHLVRDQGVGGSNPLSPTILHFWPY
jgi:hypothetical protein